jgi:hypothetical protein
MIVLGTGEAFFVVLVFNSSPGVTVSNFSRLHEGMPRHEVDRILGSPGKFQFHMTGSYYNEWETEGMSITIRFSYLDERAIEGWLGANDGRSLRLNKKKPPGAFDRVQSHWRRIRKHFGIP